MKTSDTELSEKINSWNATTTIYPARSLQELFEEQVIANPHQIAIVCDEQSLSYEQLNHAANQLANLLRRDYAIGPETMVAVCLDRSLDLIIGILAIIKAGGAYVPLDPTFPLSRLQFIVSDTQPRVLITSQQFADRFQDCNLQKIYLDGMKDKLKQEDNKNPIACAKAGNLAYVLYTSGSTGKPKGVLIEQRSVVRLVKNTNYINITEQHKIAHGSNITFDVSTFEIWGSLLNGATLCLVPKETMLSAPHLKIFLQQQQINILWLTAGLFNQLVYAEHNIFAELEYLIIGGEALDVNAIQHLQQRHTAHPKNLLNGYGPTESTTFATTYLIAHSVSNQLSIPIGRPIANTKIYILDSNLQPVAIGATGEIYIGGDGVARGYLNRSDLNQEKFIKNPFDNYQTRLYKSGDLARYLPNGDVEYLGRVDNQIKLRGYRIELSEIEHHIYQQEWVQQAIVTIKPDHESQPQLVAYLIVKKQVEDTLSSQQRLTQLHQSLKKQLPDYMLPVAYELLTEFPLNSSGKVDYHALPQPKIKERLLEQTISLPTSQLEVELISIWCKILGVTEIGVLDNFFELGGNSIDVMQLCNAIAKQCLVTLTLKDLFKYPTIQALAQCIQTSTTAVLHEIVAQRPAEIPLSMAQQRLWVLQKLKNNFALYNIPILLRLQGELNINALRAALNKLMQRHEILRTAIQLNQQNKPVQIIEKDLAVNIEVIPSATNVENLIQIPFDLDVAPLWRVKLIQVVENETVLFMLFHHIIFDGFSMDIFLKELTANYNAIIQNSEFPDRKQKIHYADFTIWQRSQLTPAILQNQLNYWTQQLSGVPERLELPYDKKRLHNDEHQTAVYHYPVNNKLLKKLQTISQTQHCTLFIVLLSAWQILLHRYTNQNDVVVGTPIAGRHHPKIQNLLGFFVNTVAIRNQFNEHLTYVEHLQHVCAHVLAAYENQDVSLEQIVDTLNIKRDLSYHPLFQTVFLLLENYNEQYQFTDLRTEFITPTHNVSDIDLRVIAEIKNQQLSISIEYLMEAFSADMIKRLAENFEQLLESICVNINSKISSINMLTAVERQQLLDWSENPQPIIKKTVVQMFEQRVVENPNAIALVMGEQQLTYAELNAKANQFAYFLQQHAIAEEKIVAIALKRSFEFFICMLGVLKAGAVYLPLDPSNPVERNHYILNDANVVLLITSSEYAEQFLAINKKIVLENENTIHLQSQKNLAIAINPRQLAYVIYTSGSTGKPKGVLLEHQGLSNLAVYQAQAFKMDHCSYVLQFAPLSFDASVSEWCTTLCLGATLCLPPTSQLSNESLIDIFERYPITHVTLPPSIANVLPINSFSKLKTLIVAGDACPEQLKSQLCDQLLLINAYGPTEATVCATMLSCSAMQAANTIGRPLANTQIFIFDQYQQLTPFGAEGELYIGGVGVARGYINQSELTENKFLSLPLSENKIYRTGDRVRYSSEGNLEFLGRIDHQVKIRGFRIELSEIETVINSSDTVQSCIVQVLENAQQQKQIVAYIVFNPLTKNTRHAIAEVQQLLQQKLPAYMRPHFIMPLASLPLTAHGKIDRNALPKPEKNITDNLLARNTTQLERTLIEIWSDVLQVEHVNKEDNFFEIGGDSITAIQVVVQAQQKNINLDIKQIFDYPVLSQLANCLEQKVEPTRKPISNTTIQTMNRQVQMPLSYTQQQLWILQQVLPHKALYNIPIILELKGDLNIDKFEQALQQLLQRHEILRISIGIDHNQQAYQLIPNNITFNLEVIDFTHKNSNEITQHIQTEINKPFVLEQGPLIRAQLLTVAEHHFNLVLTLHHIIADGWSMSIFMRDLSSIYQDLLKEKPIQLPMNTVQYADFSNWQKQNLSTEEIDQQLDYWEQQLAQLPQMLALPYKNARPKQLNYTGERFYHYLSAEQLKRLQSIAEKSAVTLPMLLLTAFSILLTRYTKQTDIVLGMPVANRPHPDTFSIIGPFINTITLRNTFEDQISIKNLLLQIKQTVLSALQHQAVPFEQVVSRLNLQRHANIHPIFQVLFVEQNYEQTLQLPNVQIDEIEVHNLIAKFDLTFLFRIKQNQLELCLEYATDLFAAETIQSMLHSFVVILNNLESHLEKSIQQIPLIDSESINQLNRAITDYPVTTSLTQLFEQQVILHPKAIALTYNQQRLSYAELNNKANQLAHYLRKQGVGSETLVAVCLERSTELVVTLLAILKSGGAYVPLDPHLPDERLNFILTDTEADFLVTHSDYANKFINYSKKIIFIDKAKSKLVLEKTSNLSNITAPNNLAYVIYTSGTTGKPKGVLIEHHNVMRLFYSTNQYFNFTHKDVWCMFHSYGFDFSVWEMWGALLYGGRLVIVPYAATHSPATFYQLLVDEKVTVLNQTPSAFRQLIPVQFQYQPNDLNLRYIIFGGEALEPTILTSWFAYQPGNANFINMYGITETTVHVTYEKIVSQQQSVIGQPLADLKVYILDEQLHPVPLGAIGELYVGGAGLARGYLNRPTLTAQRFIKDPFTLHPKARLYKTGDLVRYRADQKLEYIGRNDQQIKLRGFRIELSEIEQVIKQYMKLQDVVVHIHQHDHDSFLVAYLVNDQNIGSEELTQLKIYLSEQLPDYMVPTYYQSITELPLTENGKFDRSALPVPILNQRLIQQNYVKPRSAVEEQMADIWSEVLKIPTIGVHDDFFALGGNSLLAIQLMMKINAIFTSDLVPLNLFNHSTISSLVEYLNSKVVNDFLKVLQPINTAQTKQPLFLIHPSSGLSFCYLTLAKHITDHAIIGINNPYFGQAENSFNSIEAMAAAYIKEIKSVQQRGPYYLGGWSLGGLVAFEMAQQLKAQGEHVENIILIDSFTKELFTFDMLTDAIITADLLEEGINPHTAIGKLFHYEVAHTWKLMMHYQPRLYTGRVTMIKAHESHALNSMDDLYNGWKKYVSQPMEFYSVPGRHGKLFFRTQVKDLAEKLRQILACPKIEPILLDSQKSIVERHLQHAEKIHDQFLIDVLIKFKALNSSFQLRGDHHESNQ